MEQSFFLEAVLPLIIETVVAVGVLVVGLIALRTGERWAWFVVAAGALWGLVQLVYLAEYVLMETSSTSFAYVLYEHHLLTPLRYLRLVGLALLVPAVAGATAAHTRRAAGWGDRAPSEV
ncbi:hypothetical protein I601_1829 [Nocardioides dokdonensis FR1436]|uniref:Uncharacterized protein n=1 Tax=Nocardioides dokdonensis FR1436 TaxID=1300347 RepID=A0A1A9GKQ3_9ACTN|nr:hypothetical protein [Nocardioides dokdonensis]ANH38260.1 hypothetical protein I601_1829 [Nocardioides dokdonensis FR1436]